MQKAFKLKAQCEAPALLDFYKCFHAAAYKKGVQEVTINFTGRSGNHSNLGDNTHYMFAGLQAAINTMVDVWTPFFRAPVENAVATYKRVNEGGLGRECDTSRLEELHAIGHLPLEFRSVQEGSALPYGVAAFTVVNTHENFYWLPNYIETFLSAEVWPVQTSLTTATAYMKTVQEFAVIDGSPEFLIPFLCHDFSMRGMMGATLNGGAALSGMGHLMSGFAGSDTLPAALRLETDYDAYLGLDRPFETIASVDATEHSVQCSFNNDDLGYFRHCMQEASPTGILSLVSDGYDFWKLVTELLPQLKDEIMAREGKIVIRPDSGNPADVLCGTERVRGEGQTPQEQGLIEVLFNMFGGTDTDKGFKLLDEHIGAIYGDSITLAVQRDIYERLHAKGFAIANTVLGVGSYSYQYVTRDTHGSAVKATNMILDGVDTPIQKEVKGSALKKSAKGRLRVQLEDGDFVQYDVQTLENVQQDGNEHGLVWSNGVWMRTQDLANVRATVADQLHKL